MVKTVQVGLVGVLLFGSVGFAGDRFKSAEAKVAKEKYEGAVRKLEDKRKEEVKKLLKGGTRGRVVTGRKRIKELGGEVARLKREVAELRNAKQIGRASCRERV